jgi:hypothetical protein
MISKLENTFISAVLLACLALTALLATPAIANPRLSGATLDQIRSLCEASSMNPAARRDERRCRAEWQSRLERLSIEQGRAVRLHLR